MGKCGPDLGRWAGFTSVAASFRASASFPGIADLSVLLEEKRAYGVSLSETGPGLTVTDNHGLKGRRRVGQMRQT